MADDEKQPEGSPNKRIWWLASYPKSGNTWLRMFMSAYHRNGKVDINAPTHTLGDLNDYFYQIASPVQPDKLTLSQYLLVRPTALLNLAISQMGDPLMIKTHCSNSVVDRCPLIPPQVTAGAIYIVRDPRDVVVSWAEHLAYTIDTTIEKLMDRTFSIKSDIGLMHILSDWTTHVKSWMDETAFRVGIIKYEDLVDNPAAKFRGILDYLGITIEEDRLQRALEATSFKSLQKQETENGFIERRHQEQFFKRGTYGGWKDVLSNAQVRQIEAACGEMMTRLGYECSAITFHHHDRIGDGTGTRDVA